jgi:hypothetical protein
MKCPKTPAIVPKIAINPNGRRMDLENFTVQGT